MKTVAAIERGMSKSLAARLFDVSLSSVKRYQRLANQGGSVRPRKSSRRPRKADETAQRLLEEDLKERPAVIIGQKYRLLEHITLAHRPLEGARCVSTPSFATMPPATAHDKGDDVYQREMVLYTRGPSLSCWRAKRFLGRAGYSFEVVDVAGDPGILAELSEVARRKVPPSPYVFVDRRLIKVVATSSRERPTRSPKAAVTSASRTSPGRSSTAARA
jgi:glutaredoxin/predicted transcriptional regulator